ncbi:MAG: hypothetical protein AAFP86_15305, partial [Planctomycetota bacterium]
RSAIPPQTMKHDPTENAPRPFTRKQKLIDRQWQLGLACGVTMLMLGSAALYMLGAKLVHSDRVLNVIGPSMHGVVAIGFDVLFFLAVVAAVHHVIVTVTHAVVGPAFVLERGLRSLADQRYDARFKLRTRDYLRDVALAAEALQTRLAEQAEIVRTEVDTVRMSGALREEAKQALDRIERALQPTFAVERETDEAALEGGTDSGGESTQAAPERLEPAA